MLINFKNKSNGGGGIPEAPIDGKQYARQDANWTEVQAGAGELLKLYVPGFGPDDKPSSLIPEKTEANKVTIDKMLALFKEGKYIAATAVFDVSGTEFYQGNLTRVFFNTEETFMTVEYLFTPFSVHFGYNVTTGALLDGGRTRLVEIKEKPIEVVVPGFDFTASPITIKYDITPNDKTANIEASQAIAKAIQENKCPNVVIRDNRKLGYFTPWKVTQFNGKPSMIALQEMWNGKNEIVGYDINEDGSVKAFTDWSGADARNVASKQYVDDLVGAANNKLETI